MITDSLSTALHSYYEFNSFAKKETKTHNKLKDKDELDRILFFKFSLLRFAII